MMSDTTALTLTAALLLFGLVGYANREALQPTRGAVVAYLAGTAGWGLALAWVWTAWAATETHVDLCPIDGCDAVAENAELHLGDLPGEVLLSQEWFE